MAFKKKLDAVRAKSLKVVGRGTGLERTAAKHCSTGELYRLCDFKHLSFAFNRARAGNNREDISAYSSLSGNVDNRVVGMEFTVRALERIGYALYAVNDIETREHFRVDFCRVSDKSDYSLKFSVIYVDANALSLYPSRRSCLSAFV